MAKKKVSEIKENQGFKKKGPACSNCQSFSSDINMVKGVYGYGEYSEEKNKRCNFGGFVTGKSNWCKFHVWKG